MTSPDLPIACSLTAHDLDARRADLVRLADDALRSRSVIDGGERLVFTADDDTARRLATVVAAEAECCPFLHMELRREETAVVLEVTGPPGAQPIIGELFA